MGYVVLNTSLDQLYWVDEDYLLGAEARDVDSIDKLTYLIKKCFNELNNYKRLRALEEKEKEKGNLQYAEKLELQRYKAIDQLELTLRGVQSENRTSTKDNDGEDEE